jgi:hypothetical protein
MWIARGSFDVGHHAEWVTSASTFYSLPEEKFAQLVPAASALPAVHYRNLVENQLAVDPPTTTTSADHSNAAFAETSNAILAIPAKN